MTKTRWAMWLCTISSVAFSLAAHAQCDWQSNEDPAALARNIGDAQWTAAYLDSAYADGLTPAAKEHAEAVRIALLAESRTFSLRHSGRLGGYLWRGVITRDGGEIAGAMAFREQAKALFPGQNISVSTATDAPVAGDRVSVEGMDPTPTPLRTKLDAHRDIPRVSTGAAFAAQAKAEIVAAAAGRSHPPVMSVKRVILADPRGVENAAFELAAELRARWPGHDIGVGMPGDMEAAKLGDVISIDVIN